MRAIAATVRSFRAPSRWNKTPSVCLFNAFRLPSAANLRRFSSADSATGGADFKRPSKRKLSEKLTEGVRLRFYTYKQCFESQRCDLLLPSAFGSQPSAFSSADSATGGADFKRPSKRKLSEKLTEGVRLRFYTNKQCFESQRCDLLLPSAFRQPPPSKREVLFLLPPKPYKKPSIYRPDGKSAKKELPPRGRGACRPLCGRQASGTPKVWHGVAVTEGVWRAQNMLLTQMLIFTK